MKQMALDIGLAASPSLNSFFPGPNREAFEHLRLWVSHAARSPVPTYLWGESGSGKTHLLRAVAHWLAQSGQSVGWLDAGVAEPGPFDPAWEVVVMDDVDEFSAVQQHAAFNWFVHAMAPTQGRQRWVLAAGAVPTSHLPLREDLRTRLGWGHVFQLKVMDDSQRRAVLRQQAEARGIFLKDEVMDYILNRFSRDLGSLMGLLDQLDQYALREQRAITIPLIKSMLQDKEDTP
ncbi:MAG: DnaA regulatory inactivator Hda [Alphaproteobacteria bacterium]|nr:DnaA regulatory inactivator Hda [Alphaproteobacteria bacterium]